MMRRSSIPEGVKPSRTLRERREKLARKKGKKRGR